MHARASYEVIREASIHQLERPALIEDFDCALLDTGEFKTDAGTVVLSDCCEDIQRTVMELRHDVHTGIRHHGTAGEGGIDHRSQAVHPLVDLLHRRRDLGVGGLDEEVLGRRLARILLVEVVVEVLDSASATDDRLPDLGLDLLRSRRLSIPPGFGEDVRGLDEDPDRPRVIRQLPYMARGGVQVPDLAWGPRIRNRVVVERGDVTSSGVDLEVVTVVGRPVPRKSHGLGVLIEHRSGRVPALHLVTHGRHGCGVGVLADDAGAQRLKKRLDPTADVDPVRFVGEVAGSHHRSGIGARPARSEDRIHPLGANLVEHCRGRTVVETHEGVDPQISILTDPRQLSQGLVPHADREERGIRRERVLPLRKVVGSTVDRDQLDARWWRGCGGVGFAGYCRDQAGDRNGGGQCCGEPASGSRGRGSEGTRWGARRHGHGSSCGSAPPPGMSTRTCRYESLDPTSAPLSTATRPPAIFSTVR